jgi:hypothetical protein
LPCWFAYGANQPVGLDQRMTAFSLRPQRKADDDEGKAKQQADHHDAPARLLLFSQNEQGARFSTPLPC